VSEQSIEVEIDELVLAGFHERDRERVAGSLRSELARLLAGRSLADGRADVVHLDYDAAPDSSPERIGQAAARALARRLAS
jgi:hypothetical protein